MNYKNNATRRRLERERKIQEDMEEDLAEDEDKEESLFDRMRRRKSSVRGSITRQDEEEKERRATKLRGKPPRGHRAQPDIIEEEDEEEEEARRAAAARAELEATGRDPEVERIRKRSRHHLPSVSMRSGPRRDDSDSSEEEDEEDARRPVMVSLPMGEAYVFVCKRWLASDEGDGRMERLLSTNEKRPLNSQLRVRERN